MSLIKSIENSINYAIVSTNDKVQEIATNPSTAKKMLQFVNKVFAMIDLYYKGSVQKYPIGAAMQNTIEIIQFYGSFKNIMFWINPLSEKTIDRTAFRESLTDILNQEVFQQELTPRMTEKRAFVVNFISYHLFTQKICSQNEAREVLKRQLVYWDYDSETAQRVADKVIIQKQSRPIHELLAMVCFTIDDLSDNLKTLQKWNILNLSKLTTQIGSQSPVFTYVIKIGSKLILGPIVSAGLIITIGVGAYQALIHRKEYFQAQDQDQKDAAYAKLRNDFLTIASSATDLMAVAVPLIFVVNPPVVVALALVSKGTGLICIFLRSR